MKLITLIAIFTTTMGAITAARADDLYLGVGLPGLVTLGYAKNMGESFGMRAEYAGGLNRSINGQRDGVDMTGTIKASSIGAFADWFPFQSSGFRLVGGLTINDTKVQLNATGTGATTINGTPVNMVGQYYSVDVAFPKVTPYIGIGYGHQKNASPGLGFYADVGAMIGNFAVKSSTSLVSSGQVTQADVNAQDAKIRDAINKIGLIPSVSLGVVYRF